MELDSYRNNSFSQYGEDGVIEKIFEVLDITGGYVCEFGAWDGMHCSNTFNLYSDDLNYIPILIESDKEKYKELEENLSDINQKYIINKFINKESNHKDSLSNIIKDFNIKDLSNENFVLLSIDVDGPDYEIWKNFTDYKPPVVIIEAAKHPHPTELIYPVEDGGASAGILVQLGKEKGYELVCHTGSNCIFVLKELFPLFEIEDNSISQLYIYTQSAAILRLVEKDVYTKEQGDYWIEYMAATGQVIQYSDGLTPTKIF
jgi:hypothetical protein